MSLIFNKNFFTPISYIKIYSHFIGKLFYLFILVSFLVGIVESIGISTILPLLVLGSNTEFPENIVTDFFHNIFIFFGIKLTIQNFLVLILIIFGTKSILVFFRGALRSFISTKLSKTLKETISKKYGDVSYSYFYNKDIGYLTNIVSTESQRSVGGFIKLSSTIVALTNVIVYLLFAFALNSKSAILVIIIGSIIHFLYKKIRSIVTKLSIKVSKSNGIIQNLIIQFLSNIKYLKTTGQTQTILKKISFEINNNRYLQLKNLLFTEFVISSFELINIIIFVIITYILVVIDGQKIILVIIPLIFLYKGLSQIATMQGQWQIFLSKSGGIKTIQKEITNLDNCHERSGPKKKTAFLRNAIQLKDICYRPEGKEIISSINLEIIKGETIGLAGASGAGKTTLVDIISGLITPSSGKIRIDGVNYSTIEKNWLRQFFGYVTQDPAIFNDTIKNNITMWGDTGKKTFNVKRLHDAITLANCDDFINSQKDGLDTLVGDRGITLSGGQKQKLAIARELYRDCELLIFDEATASLDTQSEREIQRSIERLKGLKTVLVIAHRLSTLRKCDSVIVMKKGTIIEKDTFSNLRKNTNSTLYKMIELQNIKE